MCKRIISIILVIVFVVSFASCDSEDSGVTVEPPTRVAVGIAYSPEISAAQAYASLNGYELVEYDSRNGAAISVENNVSNYIVINSDEATDEYISSLNLRWVEDTAYKMEYCAYFNKGSEDLQKCFNSAIAEMRTDGTLSSIKQAYKTGEDYKPSANPSPKGKLTILCAPVFDNRFCYNDNGEIVGVEYDIIQELCNYLSVEADIITFTDFSGMFTALEEGRGDVIISSVEYTEKREEQFLCSDIYDETTFGVYESAI